MWPRFSDYEKKRRVSCRLTSGSGVTWRVVDVRDPRAGRRGQYETTVSTIADRVARVVIAHRIGIAAEKVFHRDSYGTGWAAGLARHRSRD